MTALEFLVVLVVSMKLSSVVNGCAGVATPAPAPTTTTTSTSTSTSTTTTPTTSTTPGPCTFTLTSPGVNVGAATGLTSIGCPAAIVPDVANTCTLNAQNNGMVTDLCEQTTTVTSNGTPLTDTDAVNDDAEMVVSCNSDGTLDIIYVDPDDTPATQSRFGLSNVAITCSA